MATRRPHPASRSADGGTIVSCDMEPARTLLLLGRGHQRYGLVTSAGLGDRAAVAICVGDDPDSPSNRFKHDPDVRNEDALCVHDAGGWVAFAVADAHFGPDASHFLVEQLHRAWLRERPTEGDHLLELVASPLEEYESETRSESTLVAVVFDRVTGRGFGVSFGDSSFMVLGPGRDPEVINERNGVYVRPSDFVPPAARFEFDADPSDLLLAFTDGVDECHYRSPATSVRPDRIAAIARAGRYVPLWTAQAIAAAALRGVDGHPGGQDNIAIVAVLRQLRG